MKLLNLSKFFIGGTCVAFSTLTWAQEQACPSPTEYEYDGDPQIIELTNEDSQTVMAMVQVLSSHHYQKLVVDDDLSAQLLEKYLERLDPTKSYFLQSDVDEFENKYATQLDDHLKSGNLIAAEEIYLRYRDRATTRLDQILADLEGGAYSYTFETDDSLPVDRDLYVWPTDAADADQLWDKLISLGLLNLKLSGEPQEDAVDTLLRRYKSQLSYLKQQKSIQVVDQFLNAYGRLYDPHTDYFSPRNSENFEINMSLSLEGIGAQLQTEDELTEVVELIPGGPAELGGELKPGDRITNIGEGLDCEYIDVVGWRIDEVVDLIRGPKGTTLRLEVIPSGVDELSDERKVVTIVRDRVKLEDNAAKSEMIEMEIDGVVRKIGVIDIPSFYLDVAGLQSGDPNYRSTTRDVRILIDELNADGMEGLILDLRQNGGGSLLESATLTDLFIDPGVVVQIRNQDNRVSRNNRARQSAFYSGPLLVMINRLSASASEIFAGAIQDYERGIVVGSQSFGKGTVQSILPLPKGQIKITESKFYRVSGESTQHRGVTPDIEFPSLYDPDEIGESSYDKALDWDRITGIPHKTYPTNESTLPQLIALHSERLQTDPDLVYLQQRINLSEERSSNDYVSLNEQNRLDEKELREEEDLEIENAWRASTGRPLKEPESDEIDSAESDDIATGDSNAPVDSSDLAATENDPLSVASLDGEASENTEEDEDELPDALLDESARILIDFIALEDPDENDVVKN